MNHEYPDLVSDLTSPVGVSSEQSPEMKRANNLFDFVELLTFTVLGILLLSTFFLRHSVVQGSSMDQTLANGEHLLVSDFLYTPSNGDIVVFEALNGDFDTPLIKRVIAVAGQTVAIVDGMVYIDGVALREDYTYLDYRDSNNNMAAVTVPDGFIFVMGDHRNVSQDSRYHSVGMVDVRSVLGKVIVRLTPFSRFGTVK